MYISITIFKRLNHLDKFTLGSCSKVSNVNTTKNSKKIKYFKFFNENNNKEKSTYSKLKSTLLGHNNPINL